MKHLTIQDLHDLGFEIVKSYKHDNFWTQRRRKGCITVETTWTDAGDFESQEIQIDDGEWRKLRPSDIARLDIMLNYK